MTAQPPAADREPAETRSAPPAFRCLVHVGRGLDGERLLSAARRAGAVGVVDLSPALDRAELARRLGAMPVLQAGPAGLRLSSAEQAAWIAEDRPAGLSLLVAPVELIAAAEPSLSVLRASGVEVLGEALEWSEDLRRLEPAIDGYVLKGHECGGLVSEQTTFVLLQQFLDNTDLPLLARGGVTPETAAAARLAGAAGVVLDDQVLLLDEAPRWSAERRRRLETFGGAETLQVESLAGGRYVRGLDAPGGRRAEELRRRLAEGETDLEAIAETFSWDDGAVAPAGQSLALAAPMAARFGTLGRLIAGIRKAAERLPDRAAARAALAEDGPLAQALGTRYPILQGPMTRVSDVSDFFLKVAEGGALPFAALAVLRGPTVEALLAETAARLGDWPWGVGLLGFADKAILDPQIEAVLTAKPNFALVAGARINQVLSLEKHGISTFVHAASVELMRHYLDEGVRRFVVEGRECGGHIGPMTSFMLWASVIEGLRDHPVIARSGERVQIVFAGGVHDARSAAMAATIAEPLAQKGVSIGVLMGTAYLFTREIVESGAIVPDYQQVALDCGATESLWEGPGFASRCAITPISEEFRARKLAMERAGASATEIREELETMSLGRLRMATKGLARTGETLELTRIDEDQRRAEGMYMIGQVAAMHDAVGSIAELHETVSAGSTALLRERAAPLAPARPAVPEPADVAIVGMATILPGAASLNAFWRRLVKGESAIREIPTDRWPLDWYFDEDRHARDRIYSRWGGFVDDVAFDPLKYGIPPAALASIDPMQLLSLELMSALVKDAGDIAQEPEDRARTSVIFGFSGGIGELGGHYAMRAELPMVAGAPTQDMLSRLPEWTEDSFAGLLPNVSAGRVANRFDLGGSNFAVDAACASSLTAVYSAVMELESGRADAVIAGGIDVTQAPFGYLCFSKTQALSPRGVCNTFDASADGIVISEGLAAVALKRLSDAERDGDRIYAVIKGVGASSDGRARGLTAPLPAGQRRALDRAYAQARYAPSDVDLFEAHGTGTVAGDKAELDTVTGALRACGAAPRTSAIGSVKTLIGHTKATAGVAGLIKVALGLHNRVLPPHANVSAPNAALEEADTPLYLEQSVRPWVSAPGRTRRAGVSSFGFGGTNFHVTVEEYAGAEAGDGRAELGLECVPFGLAAETREALFAQVEAMLAAIDAGRVGTAVELADIAAGDGVVRAGFVATSLDEAAERLAGLRAFLRGEAEHPPKGVQFDDAPALLSGGKLAFLFPGQGSQHPSMLARAALLDPAMSSRLDEAEGVLAETPTFAASGRRLSSFLYPGDAFAADARKRQMTELTATEVAQPALGAVEGGLAAALMGLGAAPDMAAGHSYGEFVALHAAGVLSFDDLLRLSEARGRAMVENSDPAKPGAMAAVAADEATTRAALTEVGEVVIANLNSPRQTVIAGPQAAVEAAIPALEAAGLQVTRVPVSQAFHSPLMHAAKGQFEAALRDVAWGEASMPVYSNATGRRHAADPTAMRDAMAEHLISSVDFVAMIRAMFDDGARVFVEVGPKSVLTSRVSEILGEDAPRLIAVDRGPDGSAAFMDALVQLHVCGAAIDLAKLRSRLAQVEPAGLDGDPDRLWLVNGAYARKASAPPRTVSVPASVGDAALPGLETAVSTGAPGAAEATSAPGLAASPVPRLEFVAAPDEGAPVGDGPMNDASSILSDYHAMMRDFLRVQENVMMAYLGQAPSDRPAQAAPLQPAIPAAAAPAPLPLPTSPIVAPAPMPTPVAAAPPPAPPSPPPTEPAAAAPPADLLASFTGIVADKTGYPEDMLDPDQSMEADLGIDSIKRMELLGALQKILPDAAAGRLRDNMDEVSQLASIRAIVEFIGEGAEMAPPGAGATGQEAAARPFEPTGAGDMPATLPRFIQRPHIEPADHVTGDLPAGFPVLVTGASDGFHEDVARGLSKAGAAPTILPRAVLEAGGGALAEWLAEHWAGDGAAGLIHLETRTATPELGALDLDAWRASHEAGVKRLFELLQLAAPRLRAGGRVTVAMEAGGGFGRTARADGAAASPKDAGAIGLIKSLSREWDGCSAKVVDLDPAEAPEARAAHLIHETSFVEGRREVGYPGGRRTILRTEPASLAPPHDVETMIDADWVVLATGGARGITAECLRSLAPYRPTLVLVGRSPRPGPEPEALCSADAAGLRKHYVDAAREAGQAVRPAEVEARVARHLAERDMRRNLADFEEMGATVDYRSVDVGDPAATEALLSDLYETYGRIDLVVHGAGVIEDKLLEQKSPESFARVYDTKVDSAFCLLRGLRPEGLKGICFFTSVAGRYGNRGQTDYAAANEMLNGLAWRLRRDWPQVRVKAINWGPWGKTSTGAGMVTEDVRKQFEARGVGMVEPLPGRDLFFKEMFWSDPDEVEVVGWVADGETLEAAACELPATDGPQPLRGAHVLLRDALKRENGYRKLIWPYDLVTAPYADHHRFDGKAVLPAASLVQMMSEVPAAFGIASPVVGIADFKVLNGIALADAAVPLQFVLESDGRTVTVRPETDDRKAHYRGTLVFESAPPAPAPFARDAAAEDGLPDAASLYRDLFSHGPRFQTMTRLLSLGPDVVRAELRPTAPGDFVTAASGAAWSFDPGLLDGVLQMTWIWTTAYQGGVMLPAGIGAVHRHGGDVSDGPLYAELRVLTDRDDMSPVTTTCVYDRGGRPCFTVERMQAQTSQQLNRLRGGWQGGRRAQDTSFDTVRR